MGMILKISILAALSYCLAYSFENADTAPQPQTDSHIDSVHLAVVPLDSTKRTGTEKAIRAVGPTTQFVSKRFRMQEPNYFIFGFEGKSDAVKYKNQAKILISARFRLFEHCYDSVPVSIRYKNNSRSDTFKRSFNVDFGYRQKSFWNLYDIPLSQPMYDNNYSPSVYVSWVTITPTASLPLTSMLGYIHESNGGLPGVSRGWDRIFTGIEIGSLVLNYASWQFVAWYPLSLKDNPDIYKYCGIGELSVYFQPLFGFQHPFSDFGLSGSWKMAAENLNNLEVGVFYSPFQAHNFFTRLTPTLYLQFYAGSGENMLDYKDRHYSLRVGLATLY